MAQFTNTAPGARGVNMKDGTTVLIDAGKSIDLDKDKIDKLHPDIRAGGPKEAEGGAELNAANEELTGQVKALTEQVADLQSKLDTANEELKPHRIRDAVAGLDHKNDAHWTKAGEPNVDAVAAVVGSPLTRAAITEVAPDAKRKVA
ncbi:hypothetical protein [Sphingomonas sp.]|uniref:hypothetical protein n=1 Tax=Sphingomonas sp. TaxID=28214 RepID=UPI003B3BE0E2